MWCGTETIGDRRSGLWRIEPVPARGELSSPSSLNHPGEDKSMSRRVAEQLSCFEAVQLRCGVKETALYWVPCRGVRRSVAAVGGQRREIAVRTAAAKPSKPVTVIDYSCIAGAIRGLRQVSTSSEK